jgi:hypothetical protein
LWLWVYAANQSARRFYAGIGGSEVESTSLPLPGGGEATALRCVWPDAFDLEQRLQHAR